MKRSRTRRGVRTKKGTCQRYPADLQGVVALRPAAAPTLVTDHLLTPAQLSRVLQLSRATIGRMTRAGKIPAIKIGQQYRYEHGAVLGSLKKLKS